MFCDENDSSLNLMLRYVKQSLLSPFFKMPYCENLDFVIFFFFLEKFPTLLPSPVEEESQLTSLDLACPKV